MCTYNICVNGSGVVAHTRTGTDGKEEGNTCMARVKCAELLTSFREVEDSHSRAHHVMADCSPPPKGRSKPLPI